MKIGITGADGLLGFHARCCLHALKGIHQIRLANRTTFASPNDLDHFVKGLDGILHFAGINRGHENDLEAKNIAITNTLIAALRRTDSRPAIAFSNSTHFDLDTGYGRGKRACADLLLQWGRESGARVGNFILPHVFGEFGKPFYNSAVSTFCYQLSRFDKPIIDIDSELELVHAQDVMKRLINWLCDYNNSSCIVRLAGTSMRVSVMLDSLQEMLVRYVDQGLLPNFDTHIKVRLFNTLRSYLYPAFYPHQLKLHKDARGELYEAVKTDNGGQAFISTTMPGATRGNHWHLSKFERFLVIGGQGTIRIRKLFSSDIMIFEVRGDNPVYIDIPTFHTHSITNTGKNNLQTLFWTNEIFNPAFSDTYPEQVLI